MFDPEMTQECRKSGKWCQILYQKRYENLWAMGIVATSSASNN